jgi:hypothetical protein
MGGVPFQPLQQLQQQVATMDIKLCSNYPCPNTPLAALQTQALNSNRCLLALLTTSDNPSFVVKVDCTSKPAD